MTDTAADALTALSPLDGRYRQRASALRDTLSEFGLMRQRVRVELAWFLELANTREITEIPALSPEALTALKLIDEHFDIHSAARIKELEKTTNHDVKAVEIYLRENFDQQPTLAPYKEFIHFGCTSEDINNLAWGLALNQARTRVLLPAMRKICEILETMATSLADAPLLARTHGQPATPTTLGKELAVFATRLTKRRHHFAAVQLTGKINGATGNYNAHLVAYPNVDWKQISKRVVETLGLGWIELTTQIEPHDSLAEWLDALSEFNTVLIDLCGDLWQYISRGHFKQRVVAGETGSSTMPHKVNPIDFENAEGNLGISNALARHLAGKLPISRLQRDLTDSTVQRSLGTVVGHALVAYCALQRGFSRLEADPKNLSEELNQHWEVLAEAAQTVMRRHGVHEPYELMKRLTRGRDLDRETWRALVAELPLPEAAKMSLQELTPDTYLGLSAELVKCHEQND